MYRTDPLLIVDYPICFRRNQAAHRAAKKPPRPHASAHRRWAIAWSVPPKALTVRALGCHKIDLENRG